MYMSIGRAINYKLSMFVHFHCLVSSSNGSSQHEEQQQKENLKNEALTRQHLSPKQIAHHCNTSGTLTSSSNNGYYNEHYYNYPYHSKHSIDNPKRKSKSKSRAKPKINGSIIESTRAESSISIGPHIEDKYPARHLPNNSDDSNSNCSSIDISNYSSKSMTNDYIGKMNNKRSTDRYR